MLIQISYVSRTEEPMSTEQLLELLLQCRRNNEEQGVTGLLLYGNGTFLQAIEGEEAVIDELVDHIWKDPRHADLQMLHRKEIDERQYADWTMGFEHVTDEGLDGIEGLANFAAKDFNFDYLTGHEPAVQSLLEHYRKPHWNQLMGEIEAQEQVIRHLRDALGEVSQRAKVARLALESVVDATRDGGVPSASLIRLCESALDALRPH